MAAQPVDFRKGMDGLAALVQQALRADPFAGEVFIFRPKRADRVKILVYDGTGLCLYAKRLEAGRFSWPSPAEGVVRLTSAQLATLLHHSVLVAPSTVPIATGLHHGAIRVCRCVRVSCGICIVVKQHATTLSAGRG